MLPHRTRVCVCWQCRFEIGWFWLLCRVWARQMGRKKRDPVEFVWIARVLNSNPKSSIVNLSSAGKIACQVEEASGLIRFWFLSQVNMASFTYWLPKLAAARLSVKLGRIPIRVYNCYTIWVENLLGIWIPLYLLACWTSSATQHNTTHCESCKASNSARNLKLLQVTQNVSYFVFILSLPSSSSLSLNDIVEKSFQHHLRCNWWISWECWKLSWIQIWNKHDTRHAADICRQSEAHVNFFNSRFRLTVVGESEKLAHVQLKLPTCDEDEM